MYSIGTEITGLATAQCSGPFGTSAKESRLVTGKIIGIDPKPRNHPEGCYYVVKEYETGLILYIPKKDDRGQSS